MKNTKILAVVFLTVLLSCLMAFSTLGAGDEYTEDVFTYTVEEGKATIVKCVWKTGNELVIPETLGGYPVVAIGDGAMQGDQYHITEVVIPSSLERVGAKNYINGWKFYVKCVEDWLDIEFSDNSFRKDPFFYIYVDGELLKDLVIPESITEIKPYAFNRCTTIETVTLPAGFEKIGAEAFTNSKVKKVYVDSVESWNSIDMQDTPMKVADELYIDGKLITAVDVPESHTVFNSGNFSYLGTLDYVKIHENVSEIHGAMSSTKIKNLYIDSIEHYINIMANSARYTSYGSVSVYNIMRAAENIYIGDELLTELIIPETIKEIPYGCFKGTKGITRVYLHSNIEKINNLALPDTKEISVPDAETWFRLCDNLAESTTYRIFDRLYIGSQEAETLVIPDSVEKLPFWAFSRTRNVKNIVLSKNIKDFNKAFSNDCSFIENVYVDCLETWLSYNFNSISDNPMYWAENLYVGGELLTDIVIPDGTTEIGYEFYGCETLKTVTIPASVTKIKEKAFKNCTNIEAVYAESLESWLSIDFASPESNPLYYGANLYIGGKLLDEVTLPETMSEFKNYTFYGYTNLKRINITDNVKTLGINTFFNCDNADVYADSIELWLSFDFKDGRNPMSLGKNLYIDGKPATELIIPESVSIIPSFSLSYIKNLERVEVPATTKIGEKAFCCSGLKTAVIGTLPQGQTEPVMVIRNAGKWFSGCSGMEQLLIGPGVSEIASKAFYECLVLKEITISSSVKTIGDEAFSGCLALESITFGDKTNGKAVTQVGNNAFYKCTALKNITFNTGVKSFGAYTFKECKNIENLYVNDIASYLGITYNKMHDYNSLPIYFADNFYIDGKVPKNIVIPEGVTKISDYAFYNLDTLETVQFPSTLTHIGDYAFYRCTNLRDVVFPDSLTEIGEHAFAFCKKIKNLEFPRNMKSIGLSAFDFCSSLEYVVFYKELKTAGQHAFHECENLKQVLYTGTDEQWMNFVSDNPTSGVDRAPVLCLYNPDAFFSPNDIRSSQTVNSITLKWSAIEGVTGYRVYVKDNETKTWSIAVRTTGKKTTATIGNLSPGTKYTFAVRAYINTGTLIIWSPGYIEHNTLTKPGVTNKVTASHNSDRITLKWNKVPGATGYRVYVLQNSKWKALKTTTALTYTATKLNPGTKYTFAVKAYTKSNGLYYWASKYAKLVAVTNTVTPNITKITAYTGKVKLYWSSVSGETGYTVYYSTQKDSGFKKYANYAANSANGYVYNLTSGKTYYFKVRTYIKTDSGYVYSPWSAVKGVKIK